MPPSTPTSELVRAHIGQFERSDRYRIADEALAKLFSQYPRNGALDEVLLKVTALNKLYNTNILGVYEVARHIVELGIDEQLVRHSPMLVHQVADIAIGGVARTFYSFATKYCSWHQPDAYPIYDGFVEKLLWAYKTVDAFANFQRLELKVYPRFRDIVGAFQSHYDLRQFTLRELDKFLWSYGKELFP